MTLYQTPWARLKRLRDTSVQIQQRAAARQQQAQGQRDDYALKIATSRTKEQRFGSLTETKGERTLRQLEEIKRKGTSERLSGSLPGERLPDAIRRQRLNLAFSEQGERLAREQEAPEQANNRLLNTVQATQQGPTPMFGPAAQEAAMLPITPLLNERGREALANIPVVGGTAERFITPMTSPAGLAATLFAPGVVIPGAAGSIALGSAGRQAELAGIDPRLRINTPLGETDIGLRAAGEIIGGPAEALTYGPGRTALQATGRALSENIAARPGGLASEVGELRLGLQSAPTVRQPTPEMMLVESGALRPVREVNRDLARIEREAAKLEKAGKRTRPSGGQTSPAARLGVEQARVEAEADIHRILASGDSIDDQIKRIDDEVRSMDAEWEGRTQAMETNKAGLNREWKPKDYVYGTDYDPKRTWRTKHRPVGVRGRQFEDLTGDELGERADVFWRVLNDIRYEPDARAFRQRMTPTGAIDTEQVLTGDRGNQGLLGITEGEQPIETAGPMFSRLGPDDAPISTSGAEPQISSITRESADPQSLRLLDRGITNLTDDELGLLNVHAMSWSTSSSPTIYREGNALLTSIDNEATRRGIGRLPFFASDLGNTRGPPPSGPPVGLGGAEPPGPPRHAPTTPSRNVPDRGYSGNQSQIDYQEETLLKPGKVSRLPGVRNVLSFFANPSVTMDRPTLVRYNAARATEAVIGEEAQRLRKPVIQAVNDAFAEAKPRYVGPAVNKAKGTAADYLESPQFYEGATPRLQAAAKAYDDVSNQITFGTARGQYGVDINPYEGAPGSTYVPHVQSKDAGDTAIDAISETYRARGLSTKSGPAKRRAYATFAERSKADPNFTPETDLEILSGLHDRAVARMSANETFKYGLGKSKQEIMEELHPALAAQMTGLRKRLQGLRGAVGRLNAKTSAAIDEFLNAPEEGSLSNLADALDVRVARGKNAGADVKALQKQVDSVRAEIRRLRPGWESASTGDYVRSPQTFRFHTADQAKAIDQIVQTRANVGEGLFNTIDEIRLVAFGADVSPLTIQGALGLLIDPIQGARSLPTALRELFTGSELARIRAAEPEMVQRFVRATQRHFGEVGPEFVQSKRGIERIPGGHALNQRLMGVVESIRYNQWKSDTSHLIKGGLSQNVADAEAANMLGKAIPGMNPAERGVSVLRARAERLPIVSTSFLGGPATLIKDATSGLAKLVAVRHVNPIEQWHTLSGRERLAIERLTVLMGSLTTLSVGTHIAAGRSPEEAVRATLDPSSPRFLSVATGKESYVPLGGPFRSTLKGMAPAKVGEVDGVPVYVPFAGAGKFLQGKLTPGIRTPLDLWRNKDYSGRPIYDGDTIDKITQSLWYTANQFSPLSGGQTSEKYRSGQERDPEDLVKGGVAQVLGVDLRETSPYQKFANAFEEQYGHEYNPEDPADRQAVRDSEELAQMQLEYQDQSRNRKTEGRLESDETNRIITEAEVDQGMVRLAEQIVSGNGAAAANYKDARGDYLSYRAGVYEARYADLPDPETEVGRLTKEYQTLSPKSEQFTDENGDVDWDAYDKEKTRLLNKLPAESRRVLTNSDKFKNESLNKVEREFQKAKAVVDQYYDMPKYKGLTTEQGEMVDKVVYGLAPRVQTEYLRETGGEMERGLAIRAILRSETYPQEVEQFLQSQFGASRRTRRRNRRGAAGPPINPERDTILTENQEIIARYYPDLLERELTREQEAGLSEDAFDLIGER